MRRDRVLWLLLLLGGGIRFWKIRGDLPYVFHFDEPTLVDNAVWMLQHGTLNPHFFNYPTGLIYLLAALFGALLLGGLLIGRFDGWQEAVRWLSAGTYTQPPEGGILYFYPTVGVPVLYLIGRSVSAIAGIATIALVYALALAVSGQRRTARLASLLYAVSPLAVEHAHLVTTDTIATALATAALLVAVRGGEGGRPRWGLGGALAGLAAGVKYNAGLIVLSFPLLAIWRRRGGDSRALRSIGLATLAALAAFALTTPFAVLDSSSFLHDLGYEFRRVATVTGAFEGAEAVRTTALGKVGTILRSNLGLAGILGALWGGLAAVRARRYAGVACVVWIGLVLLPQLAWERLYPRYLLLIWPAVLVLLAVGIVQAVRPLLRRPTLERSVLLLLAAVVLVAPTTRLIERETRRARPDPRIAMTAWIEANLPEGERLVLESGGPFPGAERFSLERVDFLGRATPEDYLARGIRHLAASGQERRVEGEEAFAEVFENLERIRESSEVLWRSGRYTIYRLRGGPAWEEPVRRALAEGARATAREILEETVRAGRATPYAWKRLAGLRAAMGDTVAALDAYRQAARLDTSDVEIPLALSDLFLRTDRWNASIEQLERARKLAPRDPLVFHNLAVAHLYRARELYREGKRDAARVDWETAREHAAISATFAPGDATMTGIVRQVERVGRRWGFLP